VSLAIQAFGHNLLNEIVAVLDHEPVPCRHIEQHVRGGRAPE
jgi:hypothetical protein